MMDAITNGIDQLFRSITFGLDGLIYPLIPQFYNVFYELATGKFLDDAVIKTITGNIYVFVSVVMLFAFGVQLIQTIIDPDRLGDSKKGTVGFVKRMVIAVILIGTIPIIFSSINDIQGKILNNNIVEKVIMGMSGSNTKNKKKSASETAGQYIAGTALNIVLYPNENAETSSQQTINAYKSAIEDDVSNMTQIEDINEKYASGKWSNADDDTDEDAQRYVFHFEKLVSLAVGIFLLYTMIMFTFDMALRLVKIAFLQITAPVSIISYIIQGADSLNKWFKEVISTYAGVFIKLAVFAFIIIGLQALSTVIDDPKKDWLYKLLLLCGLLMFAKQLPSLIQSLFGINMDLKGGIKGRLSSMAGVGGLAARAWDRARGLGVTGAVAAVGAGVGAGKALGRGIGWTAKKIDTGLTNPEGKVGKTKAGNIYRGARGKVVGAKNYVKGKADYVKGKAEALNNTKAGQFVETYSTKAGQYIKENPEIQRAASTLKAGATAKNGAMDAAKGMYKAYKEDPLTQQIKADKLERKRSAAAAGVYESVGVDKDTNKVTAVENASGVTQKTNAAKAAEANLKNVVEKANMTSGQKEKTNAVIAKTSTKNKIEAISDERNKVIDNIQDIANQFTSPEQFEIRKKLQDFARNYKNTGVLDTSFLSTLNGLVSTNLVSNSMASDVIAAANKVENLVKNNAVLDGNSLKIDGIKVADASGVVSNGDIVAAVSEATRLQESAQEAFDSAKEKSSSKDKLIMDSYVSASEVINKEVIKQTKKTENNEKYANSYDDAISNVNGVNANNNSQTASNTNNNNATNNAATGQGRNINSINVGNINASNVNTDGANINNTNDQMYENGDKGRLNQRDLNNLKDTVRSGSRSDDIVDELNDFKNTVKDNWNNQSRGITNESGTDATRINEGNSQTGPVDNNISDDFYENDEDK